MFPENLQVMTKQRTRVYTQSKNTMTKNHQTRKERSKRRNRGTTKEPENNKMTITTYLWLIFLNTNWLFLQWKDIESQNGFFFFFFQKKCLYAVYNRLTSEVRTHGLEVKEWKRIFHADENQKLAGVAIHISDKIDFQAKTGIRDKEVII